MGEIRRRALLHNILIVVFCLPITAQAEQILTKGPARYLGWVTERKFRTCSGGEIELTGGQLKQTQRRCSNAQAVAENSRRDAEHSPLARLSIDAGNLTRTADVVDSVTAAELDSYFEARRTGEAFRAAGLWLEAEPDDIRTLTGLTILASAEAVKGNNAFIQQGRDYGARAIALLEADRVPEGFDAKRWGGFDGWGGFKRSALVSLYRETAVLAYKAGDRDAALPLLERAAAMNSTDPAVYFLMSALANDAFQTSTKEYQVASASQKQTAYRKVEAALDKVIDSYARAIAFSEGNAQYQQANAALRQDLVRYYKFRHPNADGDVEHLIDRYRPPRQ